MENSNTTIPGGGAEPKDGLEEAVARGMHELAQPFASAMASLELVMFRGRTIADYRDSAEVAYRELERATQCLEYVRQLMRLRDPAELITSCILGDVLDSLIQESRSTFDVADVRLKLCRSNPEPPIEFSNSRLRQMLFCILQVVSSWTSSGDHVTLGINSDEHQVVLRVDIASTLVRPENEVISREIQRAITLANAIAANAKGRLSITSLPMCVEVSFPISCQPPQPQISVA